MSLSRSLVRSIEHENGYVDDDMDKETVLFMVAYDWHIRNYESLNVLRKDQLLRHSNLVLILLTYRYTPGSEMTYSEETLVTAEEDLVLAAKRNDVDAVKRLLHSAICSGSDTLERLVTQRSGLPREGPTALMVASFAGNLDVVNALLSIPSTDLVKAQVDAVDGNGCTAFTMAALLNRCSVVSVLRERCDPSSQSSRTAERYTTLWYKAAS